ncbi:MAG TPA: serine/threonine-protein kinase, partial [Ktedonobacteraceae bacterium]|nr:serine/threonine-protein kinase [Ktedonobacteraceae bacterium]
MLTLEGMQLGNYDVVRRIRVGGMGAVYEGRQRSAFGRRVAIKVILGSYATDREMRRRFAREARTIAELHHPHILPLIEFGDEQGILYLVMPFIEGGALTGYLRHSQPDINDVATIFLQLLDAVEYAHDEGLIHRDIKSSNVLIEARRDGPPYVYLADFGLVRYSEQIDGEQIGKPIPLDQIPGTPHYMAPEQARGIVTTATDIYALGVLLYQMLVGELPYDDPDDVEVVKMHLYAPVPSPCERDASIPRDLGEVVRKAMAKRVEVRFTNVAEMRRSFLAATEKPMLAFHDEREYSELEEITASNPPGS